jgi:chloramphenicol 3-O-phosphotransferase
VSPAGRRVVFVSGAPGSGKSTLAGPLAAELGFTLLGKDLIKETLHDALWAAVVPGAAGTPGAAGVARAPAPDLVGSNRTGAAAMELLWALAAEMPAVVLEANFRPRHAYPRSRILALSAHPVEVNCACPLELAARRYAERAANRHPVHVLTSLSPEAMAEYDQPVGVGELITVDTTVPVDAGAVADRVRASLRAPV